MCIRDSYNLALGQSFSDEELLEVLEAVGLVDEMDHILDVMIVDNGKMCIRDRL